MQNEIGKQCFIEVFTNTWKGFHDSKEKRQTTSSPICLSFLCFGIQVKFKKSLMR